MIYYLSCMDNGSIYHVWSIIYGSASPSRRGFLSHAAYALSISLDMAASFSMLALRTSGVATPSPDNSISWQTWFESRRFLELETILFMVEKDLFTVAVPNGSNTSRRTALDITKLYKIWYKIAFGDWVPRNSQQVLYLRLNLSKSGPDSRIPSQWGNHSFRHGGVAHHTWGVNPSQWGV